MLNLSLFSMFIVISLANIFAPGAGVVYAITTGIQGGLRGNFWCRVGLAVGILVLMTASVSGLGVIVANSPTIFTVLRFIGIAYLIYLGIKAWRAPATSLIADGAIPAHNGRRQFAEASCLLYLAASPVHRSETCLYSAGRDHDDRLLFPRFRCDDDLHICRCPGPDVLQVTPGISHPAAHKRGFLLHHCGACHCDNDPRSLRKSSLDLKMPGNVRAFLFEVNYFLGKSKALLVLTYYGDFSYLKKISW